MKKKILILLTITISLSSFAQEKTKQKEVGFSFNNLDNFGLTYKFGNNKSLWRINALLISGVNLTTENPSFKTTENSIGFSVRFGKEYRKTITEKLEFRYGADLSFEYRNSKIDLIDKFGGANNNNQASRSFTNTYGVNFVIGFNYLITKNLLIGAEILPGVSYNYGEFEINDAFGNINRESEISGFNYGLQNSSALLSIAYRF